MRNQTGLFPPPSAQPEPARHIRLRGSSVPPPGRIESPVLILSGLGAVEDHVKGLGFGGGRLPRKAISQDRACCGIHAVLLRSAAKAEPVIRCGDLLIIY